MINVVSSSAVNPVIVRRVCTMILSSFANNGTSTRLATVAVSSVVSVGTLDGVSLGLLDGLLDGSSLGSLDGVSLGLLDGLLDGSSLGSLDGDEGGGSGNDDKTATTEENKYFGFVRSPDLFVCKVKAAATMTRQPRLRRISMFASFVRWFVRSFVCSFLHRFVRLFVRLFIRSFFNAQDPLFWVANFWLCWEILGASKIDGRQKLKICVVLRYIRRKFDRQTNWLFFAKRAQGHSTEKLTRFDQTSMVKTYDVKIL